MNKNISEKGARDYGLPIYFDLQAMMGHTKHLGGEEATRRLAELCRIGPGKTILNIGSGAGNSAAYIVEKYDCSLVGIDLLPGMVRAAGNWAAEKGLSDRMEFHLGDAQEIPFEEDRFDAVICESVNVFVPDKSKAVGEYFRVVKPGGYVGLCEAIWVHNPSEAIEGIIIETTGQQFQPSEVWETLMEGSGLVDLAVEKHPLSLKSEARNQAGLLPGFSLLRIWARAIKLLIVNREFRSLIKYAGSNPRQYFNYMGYGLYAGRKPVDS